MKKFSILSLMVLLMVFCVSCGGSDSKKENKDNGKSDTEQNDSSDSKDSASSDDGSPEDYTVDENIAKVPADQDNTENAPCDYKTFVEFCDGNAYVDCSEEYVEEGEGEGEYKYLVRKYECTEDAPICFTYRRNDEGWEHNWAACFSTCEKTGKSSECLSEEDGYSSWYSEYTCRQTSKGILKFYDTDKPCDSACSEDGKTCEIKECDLEKDKAYCDENGVLHECSDWGEGVFQAASFCGKQKGMTCRYDEDFGGTGCFSNPYYVDEELAEVPKDQNNTENAPCDPDTFIQFCDGNTSVFCGYDGEKDIVVRAKCDETAPICLAYAYDYNDGERFNNASCYSSCDNENVGEGEICLTYNSGYTFEHEKYKCIETSKGKLRFIDERTTCNSACSADSRTCEIQECDPSTDNTYCDENGVLHECIEWSGMEIATFCEKFEDEARVCEYNEYIDGFTCMPKPVD